MTKLNVCAKGMNSNAFCAVIECLTRDCEGREFESLQWHSVVLLSEILTYLLDYVSTEET